MKKSIIYPIGFIVIFTILVIFYFVLPSPLNNNQAPAIVNPSDAAYLIDGQQVNLKDGQAQTGQIKTKIFGQPQIADVNQDGFDDAVVILTQNQNGNETLYYIALTITAKNGYRGTNAILLGDRISPQTINTKEGLIIVTYADREPGQPTSARPSVGVSKYLIIKNSQLEEIKAENDLIKINYPTIGQTITSPLSVAGQAKGTWYFEATFPLALIDQRGQTVAESFATAKDDWMTENFVPFEGEISFTPPPGQTKGTLIFKKDNPSGLPEYEDQLEIPIFFQ